MSLLKLRYLFFFFCFFCIAEPSVFSQAVINFRDSICNFGNIKETNGIVEHTFHFTNSGNDSLVLSNVKASCGCTVPEWNQEIVAPGQLGFIKLKFNPKGIRGNFYKTIRVTSNALNNEIKLYLSGDVIPEDTSYKYNGPFFQVGNLKFSTIKLSLDTVFDSEIKYDSVLIINVGTKPLSISLQKTNEQIDINLIHDTIMPQMHEYIKVSYNAITANAYGDFFDRITVLTNDSLYPKKSFSVHGFVKEDFSMLSAEEIKKAPAAVLDKEIIDLGDMKQGDKIPFEFELKNAGNNDLSIRKIKPACGCTALTSDVKEVKAGETVKLQFVFDSTGKTGKQNKKILLIVNDPTHPIFTLFLQGNVLP
jgi:hypothetical protein